MGVMVRFRLGWCSTRTWHDHFEWGRMNVRTPLDLVEDLKLSSTFGWRSWVHRQKWMENSENGGREGYWSNWLWQFRDVEIETWIDFVRSSFDKTVIDCHGDQIKWLRSDGSVKSGRIRTALLKDTLTSTKKLKRIPLLCVCNITIKD